MSIEPPTPGYRVVPGMLRDREQILGLWKGQFQNASRLKQKFDWFYRDSPLGAPLVSLLMAPSEYDPVGTASAGPRRMLWQGREIRAGLLVDFAVASNHRSAGPALLLARSLIANSRARFGLLYGFPNHRALVITRRVGHQHWASMRRFVCVLRHAYYLTRHLPRMLAVPAGRVLDWILQGRRKLRTWGGPRLHTEWSERSDARFDDLWRSSEHGQALVQVHDAAMAAWRYDRNPLETVRYLLVTAPGRDALLAWFAVSPGGDMTRILDFWSVDAASGIDRSLVNAVLVELYRAGHRAVSFEFAGHERKMRGWRLAGFVERDHRTVCGSWTAFGAGGEMDLHLTAGDEDQ